MIINRYPDGTSYINNIKPGWQVFRINTYEDLWHLNQFVDAFRSKYSIKPDIIIPNLIDSQADRRFNKGESFGLKLVLKFLNNLEANFRIFHPHNPELVEFGMNNVEIIDNKDFILRVLHNISKEFWNTNISEDISTYRKEILPNHLTLLSSDAGGFKPLMKLADKINWSGEVYSASKSREYKSGNSNLVQIIDRVNFEGKDILIVDDICVYGGTFKELSKLLKERNCGKLYLAVSHITVQYLGSDPVTNYFDTVFTTNSKFEEYYESKGPGIPELINKNLQIIKLF